MQEKYLPIGTVCRLKDGKKNLMIVGFMASSNEVNGKLFDYTGVLHPEGVLSSDMNFLFNHDQIEEILFSGFVNDEETIFKRRLHEFSMNGTIDGQTLNMNGTIDNSINVPAQHNQSNDITQPQMFNGNQ